ncbi:MAG: hypothetical protein V3R77_06850 [Candidatus Binatia bacterium]
MLRGLVLAVVLSLATATGAQAQEASPPPDDEPVPEHATNRKIRSMNEVNEQRRTEEPGNEGEYSDYSLPETTDPNSATRGYYSSHGGASPANPGGNAFGNKAGSAYPSDGGRAFPTTPNNR